MKRAHQDLMTVKYIAFEMKPLSEVEKVTFREMIESHNKCAKGMFSKKSLKNCDHIGI